MGVEREKLRQARLQMFQQRLHEQMLPQDTGMVLGPGKAAADIDTIDLKVFDQVIAGFAERRAHGFKHMVEDGLDVSKAMGIKKGDRILVVSSSPSKWAEAAMMAQGAQLTILEGQDDIADRVVDRLDYMFDEFKFPGIKRLKKICNDNCETGVGNILRMQKPDRLFDHVCMACVLDARFQTQMTYCLKGWS